MFPCPNTSCLACQDMYLGRRYEMEQAAALFDDLPNVGTTVGTSCFDATGACASISNLLTPVGLYIPPHLFQCFCAEASE